MLLQWAVGDGVGASSARVMLYVSYTGPFQACLFAWHHAISASKFSRVTSWAGRYVNRHEGFGTRGLFFFIARLCPVQDHG